MGIVETSNPAIAGLKGIHLFHNGLSNCSQRVRLVLAEKDLQWTSHHINLMKLEHLTPEYQAIHPKGVVPALVEDGTLVIESIDIIRYLDGRHAEPTMPDASHDREVLRHVFELSNKIQRDVKTITYERLFRDKMPVDQQSLDYYAAHQQNADLVKFRNEFAKGFAQEKLAAAERALLNYCSELQRLLADSKFMAGNSFSLADIAAIPNIHRFGLLKLDLKPFPNLLRWYDRVSRRPSFKTAITDYEKV